MLPKSSQTRNNSRTLNQKCQVLLAYDSGFLMLILNAESIHCGLSLVIEVITLHLEKLY